MIILEGTNGVGKTTYARMLSDSLGAPLYRPFRPQQANHHTEDMERLSSLGVPVNTWLEDMYVADMARVIKNQIIIDRSLPSAIAYEMVEKQGTIKCDWVKCVVEWEKMLLRSATPVVIVHLVAPYGIAKSRMTGCVPSKQDYERLRLWFGRILSVVEDLRVMTIDTSEVNVVEGPKMVCRQASTS